MQVARWPGAPLPAREPSVVTLGVFDGVHRGHAQVLRHVVDAARARRRRAAVVTFDRHPAAVLSGATLPAITSLEHRIRLFQSLGLDLCVVVRFCEEVARMGAEEFVRQVLRGELGAELIVLGYDCRFGRKREGDAALCARLGRELGFEVLVLPAVAVEGRPVSSTVVRQAILEGDFDRAGRFLGRPFSLYGTVVKGDGRGQLLGYPTANLDLHDEAIPPDGVYAGWAFTDSQPLPGVISVGRRATFHPEPGCARVVEVHLIGQRQDLYGRDVEVQFVQRLREQRVFDGEEPLKAQIARDVAAARKALAGRPVGGGSRPHGERQ
jgi:riboflavin kinase/FMN adenylyltransferase